jgi:protein-S-isoprenylcysteine O-methyltransferase Ste14
MPAIIFLPAGTFNYREGWIYLGLILIPMLFVLAYFIRYDPGLLVRRMRFREKEAEQKLIIKLAYFPFLLAFILPGLDKRFGWTHSPAWLVISAQVLTVLGYFMVFLVFRENRFASRIIEVEKGQRVISSGPYALVRHPMYTGVFVMYFFSPLALGSWVGLIPMLSILPVLILRIINEEKVLLRDLSGYKDYTQKVRYRLLPGIW